MNSTGKSISVAAIVVVLLSAVGLGWWLSHDNMDSPFALLFHDKGASQPPDPMWVSELDASLRLISETLATSGNITGALSMLDVLSARIARTDPKGKLADLSRAIAADRDKLAAAKAADLPGIAAVLDQMVIEVDRLPLISSFEATQLSKPKAGVAAQPSESSGVSPASGPASLWARVQETLMVRLSEVIRIRRVENPDALFLSPEQGALVAERLRLRLLSARIALMARQDEIALADLAQAEKMLGVAFDGQSEAVVKVRVRLQSARTAIAKLTSPSIEQSLAAIDRLKSK